MNRLMENSQFTFNCCSARFSHCSVGFGSMSRITLLHMMKNNQSKTLFFVDIFIFQEAGRKGWEQIKEKVLIIPVFCEVKSVVIQPGCYLQSFGVILTQVNDEIWELNSQDSQTGKTRVICKKYSQNCWNVLVKQRPRNNFGRLCTPLSVSVLSCFGSRRFNDYLWVITVPATNRPKHLNALDATQGKDAGLYWSVRLGQPCMDVKFMEDDHSLSISCIHLQHTTLTHILTLTFSLLWRLPSGQLISGL